MGDGLFIRCKDCEHENEFMFGVGFLFSSFESVLELLPHRKYNFAKNILKNNKNIKTQYDGYEVYQCEKCASVQNTFFLEISDENDQVLISSINKCSRCKKNRKKLNKKNNELKNYKCSKCKSKNLYESESMLWD